MIKILHPSFPDRAPVKAEVIRTDFRRTDSLFVQIKDGSALWIDPELVVEGTYDSSEGKIDAAAEIEASTEEVEVVEEVDE